MLIAIDGIDGAGKTTLASTLFDLLSDYRPLLEKEPTEISPWGKRLRESATSGRLSRDDEIEFFHKDRLFHLEHVVKPALDQGRIVILDRYVDSTLAFQALNPADADQMYARFVEEILIPDITLILNCPLDMALQRIERTRHSKSTFEKRETLERAQAIYLTRRGPNYAFIDTSQSAENTLAEAIDVLIDRVPHLRNALTNRRAIGIGAQARLIV